MALSLRDFSFADMRAAMVDSQLRTNDVIDTAIVGAMGRVARENFVPPAMAPVAYMDRAVALGGGRRLNPPLVSARLMVAADIKAGERVMVIGAATGYVAAVLAELGAAVTAVESDAGLAAHARAAFAEEADGAAGEPFVNLVEGALTLGAPGAGPFDRIIIDGAIAAVPDALIEQLVDGGVVVGALTDGAVTRLARGSKIGGALVMRPFADMDAVPLPGFAPEPSFAF